MRSGKIHPLTNHSPINIGKYRICCVANCCYNGIIFYIYNKCQIIYHYQRLSNSFFPRLCGAILQAFHLLRRQINISCCQTLVGMLRKENSLLSYIIRLLCLQYLLKRRSTVRYRTLCLNRLL